MEKTFINPSRSTLQEYIDRCLEKINYRQRARIIPSVIAPDWRKEKCKSGILCYDGGSVPGAYKYPAYTSVLEIAWWVAPDKKRHVRVIAERVRTYNDTVRWLIAEKPGWAAVYPDRAVKKQALLRQRTQRILDKRGLPGDDDRFLLRYFEISALSPAGVLVCDNKFRPTVAQVVVTCPSTGFRHCIGVPPKFVNPKTKCYQSFKSEAARVHAAIAWTFGLTPEEYQVAQES